MVDRLRDLDPITLGDRETVVELHRQLERVAAVTTRATAAFHASGAWEPDGARAAAAWLATRCRMPVPTARRRVRLGRELRHLAHTEAAWVAGDIGEAQVGVLARARTPTTADALAHDEEMLVGEAARLRIGSFVRLVAYWRIGGSIVARELRRIEDELFCADWAEPRPEGVTTSASATYPEPRPSAEPTP